MLKLDFQSDWNAFLLEGLRELGYPTDSFRDPREIALAYFNALKRRIPERSRAVVQSQEFSCPEGQAEGLKEFEKKIVNGSYLNPYLSRGLKRINYNDYLLNDWGVYHFHLGENMDSNGFIERTGPVLFSFITPNTFYKIQIFGHGNWSNLDVIEIIHGNWPDLLAPFRLDDVKQIAFPATSASVKEFRKNQINSFTQVADGTVYGQPGSGYSTDGTAVDVALTAIKYTKLISDLEENTKNLINEIKKELENLGYQDGETIELKLEISNGCAYALNEKYNIKFKLYSMNIA